MEFSAKMFEGVAQIYGASHGLLSIEVRKSISDLWCLVSAYINLPSPISPSKPVHSFNP